MAGIDSVTRRRSARTRPCRNVGILVAIVATLAAPVLAQEAESPAATPPAVVEATPAPDATPVAEPAPTPEPVAETTDERPATRPASTTRPSPRRDARVIPNPLGFAGATANPYDGIGDGAEGDLVPLPDRWRIGQPDGYLEDPRKSRGSPDDPYNQNVLKGDYPIFGQDKFLVLTGTSETLFEARKLPVPSGVSARGPDRLDFFGSGDQVVAVQDFILSLEFFQGDAAYKPRDYEVRATMVFDYNYVRTNQTGLIDADVRDNRDRSDWNFALQELFVEKHIADLSDAYDFWSVRVGTQGFNADFRGWLFNDFEPGIRFFGNFGANRYQWNVAAFAQIDKDANSGLNTFNFRDQYVFIANLYRQDTFVEGYTVQGLFAANIDDGELEFDENGFLVRPAPIGEIGEKEVRAYYLGFAGEGKWGRLNLSHQFYQAFGTETFNPLAGRETDINAQFAAAELSYDIDWARIRASVVYQSGDSDPRDGDAEGFDGIFDNPNFAGSTSSYFARQAIRLTGSGVNLTNRKSFYNSLRTSKEQGQANFVNPGLLLFNLGLDAEVTPKLKLFGNASYLQFMEPAVLREILIDDGISRSIGVDLSLTAQYRPFLNNNCIVNAGIGVLLPGDGFEELYFDDTVFSTFVSLTLTY